METGFTSQKWINSYDGKLVVHPLGENIRSVFGTETSIISIFGKARQGKSFLMNCLAGERDIFRVSNEKDPCTQGIDISNKWMKLSDFSTIDSGILVCNVDKNVGFVDAEGQGDRDVTYDATLVCPILLASKCVVFNWKGDLQKDHILNTLGIMTKAAKNVGNERGGAQTKFSHLHIVFRDWQAEDDVAAVRFFLLGKEHTTSSGTRDIIREELEQSFASITVWLFPAPTELVADLRARLTIDKTTKAFRAKIRDLRYAMAMQLKEPTIFAGRPLAGNMVEAMIHEVAAALNRGEAVLPEDVYTTILQSMTRRAFHLVSEEMRDAMVVILDGLKEEADGGELIMTELEAQEQFVDELAAVETTYQAGVEDVLGSADAALRRRVLADLPSELQGLKRALGERFHLEYGLVLSRCVTKQRDRALARIEAAIAQFEAELQTKTMRKTVAELDRALAEVLVDARARVGEGYYEGDQIRDAVLRLREFCEHRSTKLREQHAQLVDASRASLSEMLQAAMADMKENIANSAAWQAKKHHAWVSQERFARSPRWSVPPAVGENARHCSRRNPRGCARKRLSYCLPGHGRAGAGRVRASSRTRISGGLSANSH